jgi:hypothetical protein
VAECAGVGGREALDSKGAGGTKCKLSSAQVAELEAVLDAGLTACRFCPTLLDAAHQRCMKYRPELLVGFRAGPGSTLPPPFSNPRN